MIIPREVIRFSFIESGISEFGIVDKAALLRVCSRMMPGDLARYGVDRAGGAVAAALPYGEGPTLPPPFASPSAMRSYPGPLARLARFARADWYAELRARLQDAASRIRSRIKEGGAEPGPPRDWRSFANSRLPERHLAIMAGLGTLGRHGLVMVPGHGSAIVLGVLLLPASVNAPPGFARDAPQSGPSSASCADCEACEAACPTGALSPKRGFVRELCLQHWSSLPGALPPAVEAYWGDKLYGCDLCQEACPHFEPDASAETFRGRLGPGLPAAWLAAASEGEIRAALKGSVLGMGWIAIEALRRSAALVLRGWDGSREGLGTYRDI